MKKKFLLSVPLLVGGLLTSLVSSQLLAAKGFGASQFVQDEPLKVMYKFYNQGEDSVVNVEVIDKTFLVEKFKLPPQTFPFVIPEIPPKSRHVHTINVIPIGVGSFVDNTAQIKYFRPKRLEDGRSAIELERVNGLSTARGGMRIISKTEYNTFIKTHRKQWLIYFVISVLTVGIYYQSYYRSIRRINAAVTANSAGSNSMNK